MKPHELELPRKTDILIRSQSAVMLLTAAKQIHTCKTKPWNTEGMTRVARSITMNCAHAMLALNNIGHVQQAIKQLLGWSTFEQSCEKQYLVELSLD